MISCFPATPPQTFDNEKGCSLAEESPWEGDSDVGQSSPAGDQTKAEDGLIARNDASNRVVANLLRDDSAGCAGSTSAALGGVVRVGKRAEDVSEVSNS